MRIVSSQRRDYRNSICGNNFFFNKLHNLERWFRNYLHGRRVEWVTDFVKLNIKHLL